jgi:thiol-disulfide isomerase/thioredoxin
MLSQKIFGLPLWLILVIGMIVYSTYNMNSRVTIQEKSKESFDEKSKIKIYNFNTSWCGWSKRLEPDWQKFYDSADKNLFNVINVKCDDEKDPNYALCSDNKYDIQGFPTIIADKGTKLINYKENGTPRTAEELLKWANTL